MPLPDPPECQMQSDRSNTTPKCIQRQREGLADATGRGVCRSPDKMGNPFPLGDDAYYRTRAEAVARIGVS
jgi:hypothetical protein